LSIDPCIPKTWGKYEATIQYRSARYAISVENPGGVSRGVAFAEVDGVKISERPLLVALLDDGGRHEVNVRLG
jgi:cyclic beta-1,2-glucan synthetase